MVWAALQSSSGQEVVLFSSTVRITGLAAFLLVLVRIAIGWHFLYEGMWKYEHPSFSAEGFFRQARGPLADRFHNLIPDYDGRERLDAQRMSEKWEDYRRELASFYKFGDEQVAASQEILGRRQKQLERYYVEIDDVDKSLPEDTPEREQYLANLTALEELKATDPTIDAIPFQQKRYHDRLTAVRSKATPWLAEIDRLDKDYKRELDRLIDTDQRARGTPPFKTSSLDQIDKYTSYALMIIGAGLIVGLFTRLCSLAGAVFLASVVLAQPAWPTIYPPLPPSAGHSLFVTKEFIEMLVMLALAATPVGRWGGLDFFVHSLFFRPAAPAKGKST